MIAKDFSHLTEEVQIMRGVDHQSIVKLLSFSESPEYYFLVLERTYSHILVSTLAQGSSDGGRRAFPSNRQAYIL